jgi:hypothetical protein
VLLIQRSPFIFSELFYQRGHREEQNFDRG